MAWPIGSSQILFLGSCPLSVACQLSLIPVPRCVISVAVWCSHRLGFKIVISFWKGMHPLFFTQIRCYQLYTAQGSNFRKKVHLWSENHSEACPLCFWSELWHIFPVQFLTLKHGGATISLHFLLWCIQPWTPAWFQVFHKYFRKWQAWDCDDVINHMMHPYFQMGFLPFCRCVCVNSFVHVCVQVCVCVQECVCVCV